MVTGLNLFLAVLFLSAIAIAAEDGKPAQRPEVAKFFGALLE
jgi:hypothetical protein